MIESGAETDGPGEPSARVETGGETDRIETLEAENRRLRERLDDLEARLEDGADDKADAGGTFATVSRRGALATLAGLGVVGAASGPAAATDHNHLGETWSGDLGNHGLRTNVGTGTDVGLYGLSVAQ